MTNVKFNDCDSFDAHGKVEKNVDRLCDSKVGIKQMENHDSLSHQSSSAVRRSVWKRHRGSISLTVIQCIMAAYVWGVNWVNLVPDRAALVSHHVEVLRRRSRDPHLVVRLDDGTKKKMEFPVPISLERNRFHGLTPLEESRLVNCVGVASGVQLRLFEDRFRVWSLNCGAVVFDYEESVKYFQKDIAIGKIFFGIYLIAIVLSGTFFCWAEIRN